MRRISAARHNSQDFSPNELKGRLQDVPFLKENYEILQNTFSQLSTNENLPLLDFLAIQLDEFINQSIPKAEGESQK